MVGFRYYFMKELVLYALLYIQSHGPSMLINKEHASPGGLVQFTPIHSPVVKLEYLVSHFRFSPVPEFVWVYLNVVLNLLQNAICFQIRLFLHSRLLIKVSIPSPNCHSCDGVGSLNKFAQSLSISHSHTTPSTPQQYTASLQMILLLTLKDHGLSSE